MSDRLPPNSELIEAAVIGCLLLSPKKAVAEFISQARDARKYFYDLRHQTLFALISEMVDAGKGVDVVTVHERAKATSQLEAIGGLEYIQKLPDAPSSEHNLPAYLEDLEKLFLKREQIRIGAEMVQRGYDGASSAAESQEIAEKQLFALRRETTSADRPVKDLVLASVAQMEDALANRGKLRGLPSGFVDLDRMLSGFRPGQLIIVAARPGVGKTSLAMNIAERIAVDCRISTGVLSLEMEGQELIFRMQCARARVPSNIAQSGQMTQEQMQLMASVSAAIAKSPLHICDRGGLTIAQIRARARRMALQHDIKILVVDYIGLIVGERTQRSRNDVVSDISAGLKSLAKELRIPVIALSQLNRDLEKDKGRQPRLSDLRDSGSIEQDADVVLFIHHEPHDEQATNIEARFIVAKQRSGPTGSMRVMFLKPITRFESAAPKGRAQ